ncbi:hypothetical protein FGADI_11413 [Fusarium gaditjirri]|uniref:Uncharacterized protein n=1 Tax=Fusarium gaditjirri TaxID=282569 RepID=A0A8H4SV52_9HYPO|nr:hypothetical protein FGADI_11413 [Fusarium gaditjirri]
MGPSSSTGPVGCGSWIREATLTLILPDVPQVSTGVFSLWSGDNSQLPVQDEHQTPAKNADRITMHYKYDASTQEYVQYVSINGKQVSTLSTSKGHEAMGFDSFVECGASDCGTIGAHRKP